MKLAEIALVVCIILISIILWAFTEKVEELETRVEELERNAGGGANVFYNFQYDTVGRCDSVVVGVRWIRLEFDGGNCFLEFEDETKTQD